MGRGLVKVSIANFISKCDHHLNKLGVDIYQAKSSMSLMRSVSNMNITLNETEDSFDMLSQN